MPAGTGMNGDQLAQEMLDAIGGEVTGPRKAAFTKLAWALIRHIQQNAVVISTVSGGTAVSTSIQ